VGALLVVLGLLGVAVTLVFPPTTSVTEITERATVETQTGTSATVVGDHELYDDGETLTDEPVYVRGVAPTITVIERTRAPPGVAVEQELALVYEATTPDGTVFRERRQVLATGRGTSDGEADVLETAATLEIAALTETLAAMREEVGDAGTVTVHLAVETTYEGDDYTGSLSDRQPLTVGEDSFVVPRITATADHHETESSEQPLAEQVFQPTLPELGTVVISHTTPVFLVVGLVGAITLLGLLRTRGRVDPGRTGVEIHRHRYAEWISRGTLPETLGEWTTDVSLESLEALVDVAIDTETRVIYDPALDRYAVITDAATYLFAPSEER
jgi:hypothetical protein